MISKKTASCKVARNGNRRTTSEENVSKSRSEMLVDHPVQDRVPTFGCNKQHFKRTKVCHLNSWTISLRLMPRYVSRSSSSLSSPRSFSSARLSWNRLRISVSLKSRWSNQACVTTLSRSLTVPKLWGLSAMTTTAFCTVDRVTSGGRSISSEASICRVHAMPKREVAGSVSVAGRRRVK